jgi:hypothetical protein
MFSQQGRLRPKGWLRQQPVKVLSIDSLNRQQQGIS